MKDTIRQQVIMQLRHALHLAESPNVDVAEFDILDTDFSIDFTVDEDEDERTRS